MNAFSGSRALVTGGLGFIGSNLARKLAQLGCQVTVVDSLDPQYGGNRYNLHGATDRIAITVGDVRDADLMRSLVPAKDYIFNLAAQTSHIASMADPQTDLEINAGAQLTLLGACRESNPGVKIVFTSTRQLYGKARYLPVDEAHPIRPVDVNGVSKLAGESFHLVFHDVYGIRSCVLRLTNTYGPRMRVKDARQMFVGIWVRQLLEGSTLQVFGDGRQLRDFNYVDDCIDAILLAAASEKTNGNVYNLGSDEVLSLEELAALIVGLGFGGSYELVPFPAERKAIDIGDYYGNFASFAAETGWAPKVGLRDGLGRTLEYYNAHRRHYW